MALVNESVDDTVVPVYDADFADIEPEIEVEYDEAEAQKWFSWKVLWSYTGPGWLMSIAYLDPGNLESDLQAGAYTGYSLLWVLWWSTVLGLLLQVLAARLGVVTGKHLAQHCRANYPRWAYITLWLCTELAIVGSDIQEVLGSAIAFKLLFNLPLWAGCVITAADTFTFLGLHYFGVRKLEVFFAFLIGIMLVCFFVNYGESSPDSGSVAKGVVVPELADYAVLQAVGILGAVIMPHNIYLHSALVQSRHVNRKSEAAVAEACKYNAIESGFALFVSFFINLAVVAVFAVGFFHEKCAAASEGNQACIEWAPDRSACLSCGSIGLLEAGDALRAFLGDKAKTVWAVGLLAAGQASTMTGTYAGQFVMEGFLDINIVAWKRVALTRTIALVPAVLVALGAQGHQTLADQMDEWLNVLQSIQLPFALIPVLIFTSRQDIMGKFKNSKFMTGLVWTMAVFVIATNVFLAQQTAAEYLPTSALTYIGVTLLGVLYFGFVLYIMRDDLAWVLRAIADFLSSAPREYSPVRQDIN